MINETRRKATWQELADKVDELQEKLDNSISKDKLIEIIDFGVQATNTNDDYSIGMCNGMLYIKSVILDKEADYKKCQNNSISKDKIRKKIKEIENEMTKYTERGIEYYENVADSNAICILKDLLKEE